MIPLIGPVHRRRPRDHHRPHRGRRAQPGRVGGGDHDRPSRSTTTSSRPNVMQRVVKLHPAAVMLALLAGGTHRRVPRHPARRAGGGGAQDPGGPRCGAPTCSDEPLEHRSAPRQAAADEPVAASSRTSSSCGRLPRCRVHQGVGRRSLEGRPSGAAGAPRWPSAAAAEDGRARRPAEVGDELIQAVECERRSRSRARSWLLHRQPGGPTCRAFGQNLLALEWTTRPAVWNCPVPYRAASVTCASHQDRRLHARRTSLAASRRTAPRRRWCSRPATRAATVGVGPAPPTCRCWTPGCSTRSWWSTRRPTTTPPPSPAAGRGQAVVTRHRSGGKGEALRQGLRATTGDLVALRRRRRARRQLPLRARAAGPDARSTTGVAAGEGLLPAGRSSASTAPSRSTAAGVTEQTGPAPARHRPARAGRLRPAAGRGVRPARPGAVARVAVVPPSATAWRSPCCSDTYAARGAARAWPSCDLGVRTHRAPVPAGPQDHGRRGARPRRCDSLGVEPSAP